MEVKNIIFETLIKYHITPYTFTTLLMMIMFSYTAITLTIYTIIRKKATQLNPHTIPPAFITIIAITVLSLISALILEFGIEISQNYTQYFDTHTEKSTLIMGAFQLYETLLEGTLKRTLQIHYNRCSTKKQINK